MSRQISPVDEDELLRAIVSEPETATRTPKDRRRIEIIVSRLEDILKQERNKEGRLMTMVGRSFGGGNEKKVENHPEPPASGIVGQLETLLDRLTKTNEVQASAISKLEELL